MQIAVIPWSEVKTRSDRQRKEIPLEHIKALAESISQNGLFHAPIVNEQMELIAGDCRLRAMKILIDRKEEIVYNGQGLGLELIPVVKTHKTGERDLYRIELEENLRRKNLSQLEEAQAIAKLHELGKSNDPNWTNKQTAEQLAELREQPSLGGNEKEVADAILLSQFMEDPEVKAAKTKQSAVRIAKRKLEQEFRASLGIESTNSIHTGFEVIHGNSIEVLRTLCDGSFNGIITDPPYGIGADSFGSASFLGTVHQYVDDLEYATDCYHALAVEGFRVCQDEAHLYAFCDILQFPLLKEIFSEAGWEVWKTPIIWSKGSTGHSPRPDYGPKRTYEAILFASKGGKRIEKLGSDVIICQGVYSGDKLHAAEKPTELLATLSSWSFLPGSHILDPFCGSGSIFPALHPLGITATGIELNEQNVGIARDRISRL